jgi:rod shape-determining protein MreD
VPAPSTYHVDRTTQNVLAEHSYTSRRELDQYRFHPAVALLVPLVCLLLDAMLPRLWGRLDILDLPLVATLFFAVARRSPIAGASTGTLIGLFQDGLTNIPLGVNGIAKALIGYIAASLSFSVDADNPVNQFLMNFGASIFQSGLEFLILRYLLADHTHHVSPLHELLRALGNAVVALPLWAVLNRFKHRD